jgi:hypothetical protein
MRNRILCAWLLAPALMAQRVTEIEPNGTAATAQSVSLGRQVVANLAAGEQDWYSVTLTAAAEFHASTSGNFAVNPSVDTVVFLYDATGTTQLAWNDNQRGTHSDCGVNLQPGTYTIKVVGKTSTTAGDYGLDVFVLPPATIATIESEPNDTQPNATPFAIGTIFGGALSATTDVDYFSFTVTTRCVVQALVQDDGPVPQLDKTVITLYDATGVQLATATNATSHRALTLQHANTLLPGTYAIKISTNAAGGTPPLVYTGIGNYAVRTLLIPMPDTNTVVEAPEPNNTLATAGAIALGDKATGNITPGDTDWYLFTVGEPTTVAAITENGPTAIAGTRINILDINGTSLSQQSSLTAHVRLIYTIPVAGLYFVTVSGGGINIAGDYILHFGGARALSYSATFSQQPPSTNACPGSNSLRPALTVASGEIPAIGSTFVLRMQNTLPNALVLPYVGFSITQSGSTPLPFDLTALGAPGCFVRVDPGQSYVGVADASGVYYQDFVLPVFVDLRGLSVYVQAMALDVPNNALGISVTNDVKLILGERPY